MDPLSAKTIASIVQSADPADEQQLAGQLVPLVYDELRKIAQHYFRRERPDHTLQPTALVHEAYLRLADHAGIDWKGRAHFMAICAKVMRQILVDYARARGRQRRGGGRVALALDTDVVCMDMHEDELLGLHDALERLAAVDSRQARVVELRYFGGLNMEEIAHTMGLSKRTVEAEWTHARAWLLAELKDRTDG